MSKPETWLTIFQALIFLGALSAAIGGFGTYFARKQVDSVKDQSRKTSEAILNNKIEDLLTGNKQLQKNLEPFQKLAEARYPSKNTEEALTSLRKDIDQLQSKTAAIDQRTKQRAISSEQVTVLTNVLRNGGANKISITCVMGDQEAFVLANQFKSVFSAAGWTVDGVNQAVFNDPVAGIFIAVKGEPVPPLANTVFQCLAQAGVQLPGFKNSSMQDGVVDILVGSNTAK